MNRDYNPRYGMGQSGRVGKDDLSFDGKSWEYRKPGRTLEDPQRRSRPGANYMDEGYNEHAQKMLNPLYDYSYGDVRDASKILEIGNVNEKEEVDRLLAYLQEGPDTTDKDPKPEKKPKEKTPKSLLPKNYTPSEETASAQDFVSQYEKSIRNSPDGLLDTGSMGESQTLKGISFNAEDASEENDKAQSFFQDQLLNLTEGFKKYNINTVGPNSTASKNRDLLRSFSTT
jgi:hypothetical protein